MFSLLLALIYAAFISIGLPDSLLGSAWPSMYNMLGAPIEAAGVITMFIAACTIVSSLISSKITNKFSTGTVTAVSVLLTAIALFGFSISTSFVMLLMFAIPYGFGAGSIDAALNHYVATNYKSKHMTWLHAFWGVGATVSPYIMSFALTNNFGWQGGYRIVGCIQAVLCLVFFIFLPLWKKGQKGEENQPKAVNVSLKNAFSLKGIKYLMVSFCAYCGLEAMVGLWAVSFLVEVRGVETELAALFGSFMYLGITVGRFFCGFIADRVGDKNMVRAGLILMFLGGALVIVRDSGNIVSLSGLVVLGLGSAPVYPCIIHATPKSFGKENAGTVIGIQMASAYTGTTFLPPLFGLIASFAGLTFFPFYAVLLAMIALVFSELSNKALSD